MRDYYLGLDLGTGSVGWAVTDPEYNILKKNGKALWGVRLFDGAQTAEARRINRTSRRRLARRNWRIKLLQELFSEEIAAVDPGFYLRMKESKYYPEDKLDADGVCPELPYALFVDANFTDKEYHALFPTVYHLRKFLMETTDIPDIRLVYLAFHHMMKHRGHFLLSGDIEQISEFRPTFLQMIENLTREELDWNIEVTDEQLKSIEEVLKNRKLSSTSKYNALKLTFPKRTKCEDAIIGLLSGKSTKLSNLFEDESLQKNEILVENKITSISLADAKYDEKKVPLEEALCERFYIMESIKAVYDWAALAEILNGKKSISEAKVASYQEHKENLSKLKQFIHEECSPEIYNKVFSETKKGLNNYCAYVGMAMKNGKKVTVQQRCTQKEFGEFLKKNVPVEKDAEEILEAIVNEKFLPKQSCIENNVIPYQIHLYELKKILENLEDKIPFLKENGDKIVQLFEFKIPYYVGPLNYTDGNESNFTWAVRKSKERITPWNFHDVVDVEASAERFIRRMTNKCTYLQGEDVLPKDSLLYSKFMVLNDLNNLCINGEHLSVELKQRIYEDLFCKYRNVTVKKLKDYLKCNGYDIKNIEITGTNKDGIKSKLTAYHDLKERLTGVSLTEKDKELIILNIVLFGDDRQMLRNRLKKLFPILTDKQLKSLSLLSYKGWGRLSRAFLEDITAPVPGCTEEQNIIGALWNAEFEQNGVHYCPNLQQLLNNSLGFKGQVDAWNIGDTTELNYETVKSLYVSPSVKRTIWQTLRILKEIVKIMGCEPKRVFIEMARGNQEESGETKKRKETLEELYKSCKKEMESDEWFKELFSRLSATDNESLRNKKLYLYYAQMGRCMYTGEPIPFEDLWNDNKYNIDHIYPRSKTKDNSIDNLALVKYEENKIKNDDYPINCQIQQKMHGFWKSLLDKTFISKKKYERLVRKERFTDDELAGFISRQIVETRQSTKAVADILKKALHSEIVYVKAGTVSDFRQDFVSDYPCMIKVREMNDLHHAKDAYLNIVVGNTYFVKFTRNPLVFLEEKKKGNKNNRRYNLAKIFKPDKEKGSDVIRNGETAWKTGKNGTIVTVAKTMSKNNILVTKMVTEKSGKLFDVTIEKKGPIKENIEHLPLKSSDTRLSNMEKYGSYCSIKGSYFVLVKSKDKKGKEIQTIESVPLYLKKDFDKSEESFIRYLEKTSKLKEPKILLKLKVGSLLVTDGFKMRIASKSETSIIFNNANQLILQPEKVKVLKKALKYADRKKQNKNAIITSNDKLYDSDLMLLYDTFITKLKDSVYSVMLANKITTLEALKENFEKATIEDKCIAISELLHLFQCDASMPNLKIIGGTGSGRIKKTKTISGSFKKLTLVTQSVTGIFEKKVDLLSLS